LNSSAIFLNSAYFITRPGHKKYQQGQGAIHRKLKKPVEQKTKKSTKRLLSNSRHQTQKQNKNPYRHDSENRPLTVASERRKNDGLLF